jgi:hypothetical protein
MLQKMSQTTPTSQTAEPPKFSIDHYSKILRSALEQGYSCVSVREFIRRGCPSRNHFISRHDVDMKASSVALMLEAERELGVPSTVYIRVMGSDYNAFSYPVFNILREAEKQGAEVGLHTNFLEFALINGLEPFAVLDAEIHALRRFFTIAGISCHRDINYIHNSLPVLEENWADWQPKLGLEYQAYDRQALANTTYINEGLSPHLGWRKDRPEDIIPTGASIYLLTHNHWWYRNHPFEA